MIPFTRGFLFLSCFFFLIKRPLGGDGTDRFRLVFCVLLHHIPLANISLLPQQHRVVEVQLVHGFLI